MVVQSADFTTIPRGRLCSEHHGRPRWRSVCFRSLDMAEPMTAPERRRTTWLKATGAVVTLLIAILGAVTGTLSYLRGQNVSVAVTRAAYLPNQRPHVVIVGVTNTGTRSASIVGGSLSLNGRNFARIRSVLVDTRRITDRQLSNGDLLASGTPLPFPLPAGASLAGALLWDVTDRATYLRVAYPASRRAHNQRVELDLTLAPGGESALASRSKRVSVWDIPQECCPGGSFA